jgi:methyl-accepting chemotaxis protein
MKTWFKNMKVRQKLLYTFTMLVVFLILIGGIGLRNMTLINSNAKNVSEIHLPSIDLLLQIDRDMQQALVAQRTMIFTGVSTDKFAELKKEYDDNIKQTYERWEQFKEVQADEIDETLIQQYEAARESWIKISNRIVSSRASDTPEGRIESIELSFREGTTLFNEARDIINVLTEDNEKLAAEDQESSNNSYNSAFIILIIGMIIITILSTTTGILISNSISKPLIEASNMMFDLRKGLLGTRIKADSKDELGVLSSSMNDFADTLQSFTNTMYKVSDGDLSVEAELLDSNDEISPALNKIIYTLRDLKKETDMLISSSLEGKLSSRGNIDKFKGGYREIVKGFNDTLDAILEPLKESADVLKLLAVGDFRVNVKGDYKGDHQLMKNSINTVTESLNKTLHDVSDAVEATASASAEISSSSEEMASGAQEQSSQTAEVAAAMEEMSRTIVETASNATAASEASKDSATQAKEGTLKVNESKTGMEKIVISTKATGGIISSLANKTDQIGEIAQVIDDIADQTNLLALNAAIEAARAGEQGRGFAVVADEVRKLAERTTKATKEIAETIKAIQGEAKDANVSMQEAEILVNDGLHLNDEVGKVLTSILDGAENVSNQISQVAAASEEQSATAEQVSTNIEAINNVANESAAGVQQIASASEDLNRLTENLSQLVSKFKISNNGSSSNLELNENGSSNNYMLE